MKHIVLPTDFSDNAWGAAVYAFKLLKDEECTFYFLHSNKLPVSRISSFSNKLLEVMKESALSDLEKLKKLATVTNTNANHTIETIYSTHDIEQAIALIIEKHNADMVIMGTKGATSTAGIVFGSNTVRIMTKTKACPVLAIPDEFDFSKLKQIAFPTAFKRFYSKEELQPLKDFANLFNAKIRIVHVNEKEQLDDFQEYNYTTLKDHFENCDHSFHWLPEYSKKNEEISTFIEDLNIDMLFMINYEHGFIENFIKEPVIKKIGFNLKIPFLVVPQIKSETHLHKPIV